jgi:hypothetical protein
LDLGVLEKITSPYLREAADLLCQLRHEKLLHSMFNYTGRSSIRRSKRPTAALKQQEAQQHKQGSVLEMLQKANDRCYTSVAGC